MTESSVRSRLVLAVVAAGALVALTSTRLDVQGRHYDEIHQATAAFAYLGKPAPMFNVTQVLGLPALTMHYSGAIKTGRLAVRYVRLAAGGFIQNLVLRRSATSAPWFEGYALLAGLVGAAMVAIRVNVPATRMTLGLMAPGSWSGFRCRCCHRPRRSIIGFSAHPSTTRRSGSHSVT